MRSPVYSRSSWAQLKTADWRLQLVFLVVLEEGRDHAILEGFRNRERQEEMFAEGKSELRWPNSQHNTTPASALDAGPWFPGTGFSWPDRHAPDYAKQVGQFYQFAGYVQAVARRFRLPLRWGGDWDRDRILTDQDFDDLTHFELLTVNLGAWDEFRLRRRYAWALDRLKRRTKWDLQK